MKYNPDLHNRCSIRLQGYDYANAGAYFVTVCCQNRECLFGKIENGKMILNEYGEIAKNTWNELPRHHPNVETGEFITMPNHIHGILEIVANGGGNNGGVACNALLPRNALYPDLATQLLGTHYP